MSNTFGLHENHKNVDEWLSMSDGGTVVFLTVLVLSGTVIAESVKQKELIIWFAEHDQTVRGSGTAGFDISEIPWDYNKFEDEKEFILKVIDGAMKKVGWDVLDYVPNEGFIFDYLDTFRKLICNFDPICIDKNAYDEWIRDSDNILYRLPKEYPNCSERDKKLGLDAINDYNDLVLKFKEYLDHKEYEEWAIQQEFPKIKMPQGFPKCKKHNALLYWHGCIACNDVIVST